MLGVVGQSDEFFNLSGDKKDALAWDSPASNRGYVSQGRERVSQLSKEEVEALREATPYVLPRPRHTRRVR